MAMDDFRLEVGGYTFDNPPTEFEKVVEMNNQPVPMKDVFMSKVYKTDSHRIGFRASGELSLNEKRDLDELKKLQKMAIEGGEVEVGLSPFLAGTAVFEDVPFRQSKQMGTYDFNFHVNEWRQVGDFPGSHNRPSTGNNFRYGNYRFGYDPQEVEQDYSREVVDQRKLEGLNQAVDEAGLEARVGLSGTTDAMGQQLLWNKALHNRLERLEAEFQNGLALITKLRVSNNRDAPAYVSGLYDYDMEVLIVRDPRKGIGNTSTWVDHRVRELGTYTADEHAGDEKFKKLKLKVKSGTGAVNHKYISWDKQTVDLLSNQVNYVYVAETTRRSQGVVKKNQSGFPGETLHLYKIWCLDKHIKRLEDRRRKLIKQKDKTAAGLHVEGRYAKITWGTGPLQGEKTSWYTTKIRLQTSGNNYIYVDKDGLIHNSTTGFPDVCIKLWRLETRDGDVYKRHDRRPGNLSGPKNDETKDLTPESSVEFGDIGLDLVSEIRPESTIDLGVGEPEWIHVPGEYDGPDTEPSHYEGGKIKGGYE